MTEKQKTGRQQKFGEPTIVIPTRVPATRIDEFRAYVAEWLAKYEVAKGGRK